MLGYIGLVSDSARLGWGTMLRLPQINSQARWPRPDGRADKAASVDAAAAAALIAMLRQHVADQ